MPGCQHAEHNPTKDVACMASDRHLKKRCAGGRSKSKCAQEDIAVASMYRSSSHLHWCFVTQKSVIDDCDGRTATHPDPLSWSRTLLAVNFLQWQYGNRKQTYHITITWMPCIYACRFSFTEKKCIIFEVQSTSGSVSLISGHSALWVKTMHSERIEKKPRMPRGVQSESGRSSGMQKPWIHAGWYCILR